MRFAAKITGLRLACAAVLGMASLPLAAQVETIDPDDAIQAPIDGDLQENPGDAPIYGDPQTGSTTSAPQDDTASTEAEAGADFRTQMGGWNEQDADAAAQGQAAGESEGGLDIPMREDDPSTTYREDDLIGAAEGVFGKGAEGVAKLIRDLLADQGEPNGYIVGREAGGAFIVGARYGSGTLYHKIEGELPVYWTGPSIGFDAGANAGSTFVLVYNLYDTEELYERYPAGEGQVYVVGGMTASYLRKGDVVLIPIRVGAGLRLGVNAGYMRFSKEHRWLPF